MFKFINKKHEILKSMAGFILSLIFITQGIAQPVVNYSLKISENGHYFLDRNNHPFLWQGDTEWELFRYLSAEDAKALLIERKKQGFNVIQVMITGVFPEWGEIE